MAEIGFEDAMKRLEEIGAELEKGEVSLERALGRFEEAIELVRLCEKKLKAARERVSRLVGEDGDFRLEPFDEEHG